MHPLKRHIVTHTITFANGDKPVKVTDADRAERLAKMYRDIGVSFTMSSGDVPICPTCKIRECSYDGDRWSTWCSECFEVHAAAPWCFHDDCSRTGRGRTEFTGERAADGAPLYRCPRAHHAPMTLVQYWASNGINDGEHDALRKITSGRSPLAEVRLESMSDGATNDQHPAARAYCQAYMAAALATLAGDERAAGYGS